MSDCVVERRISVVAVPGHEARYHIMFGSGLATRDDVPGLVTKLGQLKLPANAFVGLLELTCEVNDHLLQKICGGAAGVRGKDRKIHLAQPRLLETHDTEFIAELQAARFKVYVIVNLTAKHVGDPTDVWIGIET